MHHYAAWGGHVTPLPVQSSRNTRNKIYNSKLKRLTKHEIFNELHTLSESIKY
jgi:hypothetical protein